MSAFEIDIKKNRNFYKQRRNNIRKILLVLFLLLFIGLTWSLNRYYINKPFEIVVFNNKLLPAEYLKSFLSKDLEYKNFFLLSPRKISKHLKESLPLIDELVVRKYLIPKKKIYLLVKEKSVWASVFYKTINPNEVLLVTDKAQVITFNKANIMHYPERLLPIYVDNVYSLKSSQIILLKKIYELVKNISFNIDGFYITSANELDIKANGSTFVLHVGPINESAISSIKNKKINELLQFAKKQNIEVNYLDITLETSAILKTNPKKDTNKDKKGLFNRLML